jgi:hypothetical protein
MSRVGVSGNAAHSINSKMGDEKIEGVSLHAKDGEAIYLGHHLME